MRIEELHLKNFRCFKELDIKFPESNLAVFIGLNGAGKSAILDVLRSVLSIWHKGGGKNINQEHLFQSDITIGFEELKITSHGEFGKVEVCKKINEPPVFLSKGNQEPAKNIAIVYYNAKRQKESDEVFQTIENFTDFKDWFVFERAKETNEREEKLDPTITNPKLDIIRKAIEGFCSNISNMKVSNLRVKYSQSNTEIWLTWDDNNLNISQLSEGQRNLLLLVSDIAFSLIGKSDENRDNIFWDKLPYQADEILKRKGIVLIDEIELHLHPQWQREVLPALQKTFPNIQFIVTTHSPQVLSRVHKDDIFILKDNQLYQPSSNPIGRDSSDILDEIMEITKRPDDIQKLSDDYFLLLAKNELEAASKIRAELEKLVDDKKLDKDDPIFYRANGILARKQLLKK